MRICLQRRFLLEKFSIKHLYEETLRTFYHLPNQRMSEAYANDDSLLVSFLIVEDWRHV